MIFKSFIIFLYSVSIIYTLEIFAMVFLTEEKNLIEKNMNERKLSIIKKLDNFDKRNDLEAFINERDNHDISPNFRLSINTIYRDPSVKKFLLEKIKNNSIIPFRGPLNKNSLGSNEEGFREIIVNDKYGFKNNNKTYIKKIDLMIIGDSFAEGLPFDNSKSISGLFNKKTNINSINYGVASIGPLGALGVLKEYGKNFKPSHVFYFFYEGNDLQDLVLEKQTFLTSYLDNNFNQNLFKSTKEIEIFLSDFEKLFYENLNKNKKIEIIKKNEKLDTNKKRKFVEIIKDIIELQNLKKILSSKDAYFYRSSKLDYQTFEKIIIKMNENVQSWNGNFYFVYLPSWLRYNSNYSLSFNTLKKNVRKISEKNQIKFLDVDKFLKDKNLDNTDLFNLGLYGHYTKEGYDLISDFLIEELTFPN